MEISKNSTNRIFFVAIFHQNSHPTSDSPRFLTLFEWNGPTTSSSSTKMTSWRACTTTRKQHCTVHHWQFVEELMEGIIQFCSHDPKSIQIYQYHAIPFFCRQHRTNIPCFASANQKNACSFRISRLTPHLTQAKHLEWLTVSVNIP